ncbi:hypothetical protein [Kitasatospora sp. NBC_01266]|uniref:hypothetical protein n=1 Tax=Kitasatospora sp. NBC_01266 TaxID=2903572 RepID=UPI002E2F7F19|nr:hypothetical protein [Kitasatospora sp. NBC_01266]
MATPSVQSKTLRSVRVSTNSSGQERNQPSETVLVTWSFTLAEPSVGRPSS